MSENVTIRRETAELALMALSEALEQISTMTCKVSEVEDAKKLVKTFEAAVSDLRAAAGA